MITQAEFKKIKELVFGVLKFDTSIDIAICDSECVYVSYKNGKAQIGGAEKIFVARELMLLALNLKKGKTEFEIKQNPVFEFFHKQHHVLKFSLPTLMRSQFLRIVFYC